MKKFEFIWNFVRYIFATIISTIGTSILPLVFSSIPFLIALMWIIAWVVIILFSIFGDPIDVPMGDPIGLVLIPLMFSFLGAVSVSVTIIIAVIFNFLFVLSFSIFIEFINKRIGLHHWIFRILSFLCGGVLLGLIVGIIATVLLSYMDTEISLIKKIGLGSFIVLTSIIAEFMFGLTLLLSDLFRKILNAIKRKIFSKSETLTTYQES